MLVEHLLEQVGVHVLLIHQNLVMGRTGSALDSRMRAEIHVILMRMSDIPLNDGARMRISILITGLGIFREKSYMVTLLAYDHCEFDLLLSASPCTWARFPYLKVFPRLA